MKTATAKGCPEYLTTGIVARYCGVSKVTVLRWIEKGNLTAFRLPGGQNRVHRDDFSEFLIKYNMPIQYLHPEINNKNRSDRQPGIKQ